MYLYVSTANGTSLKYKFEKLHRCYLPIRSDPVLDPDRIGRPRMWIGIGRQRTRTGTQPDPDPQHLIIHFLVFASLFPLVKKCWTKVALFHIISNFGRKLGTVSKICLVDFFLYFAVVVCRRFWVGCWKMRTTSIAWTVTQRYLLAHFNWFSVAG